MCCPPVDRIGNAVNADCALLGCVPPKEGFRPLPRPPAPPPLLLMSSTLAPASSSKSWPSPDAGIAPPLPPLLLPRPRRLPLPAATRGRFLADAGTDEEAEDATPPLPAFPAAAVAPAAAAAARRFSAAVTYPLFDPEAPPPFSTEAPPRAAEGGLAANRGLFTALFPVEATRPLSSPSTLPAAAAAVAASPLPGAARPRLPVEAELFLVDGALLVLLRRPRGVAMPLAPFSPVADPPPRLCRPRRPSDLTACSVPSMSPWKL